MQIVGDPLLFACANLNHLTLEPGALSDLPLKQRGLLPPQFFDFIALLLGLKLCPLPLADINNRGQHEQSLRSVNWIEADFDRNLAVVFAQPKEFPPGAHWTSPCVTKVTVPIAHVMRPESLGNEHLDRMPNEFLAGVTENNLCLRVNQCDTTFRIDHDHRVGCRQTELLFGLLALTDVECSAAHSNRLTVPVELYVPAPGDPAHLPIR